jgi:hypothetical protein
VYKCFHLSSWFQMIITIFYDWHMHNTHIYIYVIYICHIPIHEYIYIYICMCVCPLYLTQLNPHMNPHIGYVFWPAQPSDPGVHSAPPRRVGFLAGCGDRRCRRRVGDGDGAHRRWTRWRFEGLGRLNLLDGGWSSHKNIDISMKISKWLTITFV